MRLLYNLEVSFQEGHVYNTVSIFRGFLTKNSIHSAWPPISSLQVCRHSYIQQGIQIIHVYLIASILFFLSYSFYFGHKNSRNPIALTH